MKKFAVFAAACALLSTGATKADGLKVCFGDSVNNVALLSFIGGVENAIVIVPEGSGNQSIKANTYYGEAVVGSYWTSKLPGTVTLPSGCSVVYFMTKTTSPAGATPWACNTPVIGQGSTDAKGVVNHVVSGSVGASVTSGALVIPGAPNSAPTTVTGCPSGT